MSTTSRSVYRDTVTVTRYPDGVLLPAAGAQVRFYEANGATLTPLAVPLYASPDSTTPLTMPLTVSAVGEVEVWSDEAGGLRARQVVVYRDRPVSDEVVDFEPPPGTYATRVYVDEVMDAHEADPNPHDQYLTQPEGDLLYLPLSHQPGTDPHPQYLKTSVFGQPDPLGQYQLETEKGQPSGYVPLDPNGLIPTVHLPPLAITNTFVVASQAEMLALNAQTGDVAIRTDTSKSYILAAEPASTLANWKELSAAAPVLSVDGRVGVVDLSDRYSAAAHNHDPVYVNVSGDSMSGPLTVQETTLGYTSGHPSISTAAGKYLVLAPGAGYVLPWNPSTFLGGSGANAWYGIYAGPGGVDIQGKPVAVSPDAGNILSWQSNGFYASLTTANVTVLRRQEFSPPASSNSVTLTSAPSSVLEVSRNGVAQSAALGHYTVTGAVVTFSDAFVAGEQVMVLSEVGTSLPTDTYTKAESDGRFVNVTGDSMTGSLNLTGAAGTDRILNLQTANTNRWGIVASSAAEGGSNAGTDLVINRFSDAGAYLGSPFVLNRATGGLNLEATPSWGGSPAVNQSAGDARYLRLSGGTLTGALTMDATPINSKVPAGMAGLQVFQNAESVPRFQVRGDGALYFGPGGATVVDTTLTRTAAGRLQLDSTTATAPVALTFKYGSGTSLARIGQVATDGVWLTVNSAYDGTNWARDDTTKAAMQLAMSPPGFTIYTAPAGANPVATWTPQVVVNAAGLLTANNGIAVAKGAASYAIDVAGDVMVRGPGSLYVANAAFTASAGWRYSDSQGLAHVQNGSLTGSFFATGGDLYVKGAVNIQPGAENLAGEWLYNNGGARSGFVGLEGDYTTWRVYGNMGTAGNRLSINLSTGGVSIPGTLGVTGQITVTGGIIGNGGAFVLSATNNIQLAPGGGYIHPDGNATRGLGHSSLQWANVWTRSINCNDTGLILAAAGNFISVAPTNNTVTTFENSANGVWPGLGDGVIRLGRSGARWTDVWAANGAIQTCLTAEKQDFQSLDPEVALLAILRTPIQSYRAKPSPDRLKAQERWPDAFDLDRDPLYGFRFVGFRAEAVDPLLLLDGDQHVSPQHTASVALSGIQALYARIAKLEAMVRELSK